MIRKTVFSAHLPWQQGRTFAKAGVTCAEKLGLSGKKRKRGNCVKEKKAKWRNRNRQTQSRKEESGIEACMSLSSSTDSFSSRIQTIAGFLK